MNFESNVKQTEENKRFAEECKVIDLKYEYRGYTGEERYAIVSELSEVELKEKYTEIIRKYVPFVLLSAAQGQVIEAFDRNEEKFKKRQQKHGDAFGYEDGMTECFHSELLTEDFWEEFEQQETKREECQRLRMAMDTLTTVQRERIVKRFVCGMTIRSIAAAEGGNYGNIEKSILTGMKKIKKYFADGSSNKHSCSQ